MHLWWKGTAKEWDCICFLCFQPGDLSVDAGDGYEEDEEDEEGEEEEGLEDEEEEDDPVSLQHQLMLFS